MKRFMVLGVLLALLATPVVSLAAGPFAPFTINVEHDNAVGGGR